ATSNHSGSQAKDEVEGSLFAEVAGMVFFGLGEGEVRTVPRIVEDGQDRGARHAEVFSHREGRGGFEIDRGVSSCVPGVDFRISFGQEGSGRPNWTVEAGYAIGTCVHQAIDE